MATESGELPSPADEPMTVASLAREAADEYRRLQTLVQLAEQEQLVAAAGPEAKAGRGALKQNFADFTATGLPRGVVIRVCRGVGWLAPETVWEAVAVAVRECAAAGVDFYKGKSPPALKFEKLDNIVTLEAQDLSMLLVCAAVYSAVDNHDPPVFHARQMPYLREVCCKLDDIYRRLPDSLFDNIGNTSIISASDFMLRAGSWALQADRRRWEFQVSEWFSRYDENGDNKISKLEFMSGMMEWMLQALKPGPEMEGKADVVIRTMAAALFRELDKDNSGSLDMPEFKAAVIAISRKQVELRRALQNTEHIADVLDEVLIGLINSPETRHAVVENERLNAYVAADSFVDMSPPVHAGLVSPEPQ
mmetsp:Transcript_70838/g.189034  ORF Transcript_70838/g.189034 Transcript_70838/m.189034 type:complete len:364 (+) Transcript_70838:513-1604(+)